MLFEFLYYYYKMIEKQNHDKTITRHLINILKIHEKIDMKYM